MPTILTPQPANTDPTESYLLRFHALCRGLRGQSQGTLAQAIVFRRMAAEPLDRHQPAPLARGLCSTAALTGIIDRFEELGLTQRTVNHNDRRKTDITFTPHGLCVRDWLLGFSEKQPVLEKPKKEAAA